MPRDQRDRIECLDELRGYLQQSHLSEKNANRLKTLSSHADPEVQRLSQLLGEIAQVHPYKRRRWRNLARDHPEFRRAIGVLGIEFFEEVLLDYGDTRGPLWRTMEHFAAPTTCD